MKSGGQNQREKELFTLVPSQISPNPLRRKGGGAGGSCEASLSDECNNSLHSPMSIETTTTTTTTPSLLCDEPVLNFENLLQKRHGSVLGQDIILKSEHFFKGMNKIEGELKLFGAPNFRSTNLNIFGAAQPSSSGLATILRVLGCAPCTHNNNYIDDNHLLSNSQESLLNSSASKSRKRTIWFSTREEPIIYVNETPFVLRDLASPFVNIKSYSGISANRLESVEKRLKADILAEAKRNHGLLLIHDEQDEHGMTPCLISVDSVMTPREVMEDIQKKGFAIDYYRIPVSHEQSPTDPYIDEYFKVFSTTPTDWPVVFSCGMGIGRTTYGMVIGLLIRRAQTIESTGIDPFDLNPHSSLVPSASDFGTRSRTMLRLVYILEQGLQSKQSAQSAIEWILDRSESIDNLEAAINGNYMVINDLIRVLHNGAFCKQIVDSAIDRCDTVVNLREHILLYRVRSVVQNGPFSFLDTGLGFLERYFSLISFCQYVEEKLVTLKKKTNDGDDDEKIQSFQEWMQNYKEIWKMLTYLRSSSNKLKAFRPLEDLKLNASDDVKSHQMQLSAFRSPQMKPAVSEDVAVVYGRSGTVLGPNTILKIDHWQESANDPDVTIRRSNDSRRTSNFGNGHVSIPGAPNFRRIDAQGASSPNQIYAVAQPTLSALEMILETISSALPTPRRIVWINVREEPLLYINGEPYVLRDQYASLRNIKAYTGIAASRLEQMEVRLKEDVLAEGRAHSGRILLHSEGAERDLLPIWESIQDVSTMRDLFAMNSKLCHRFPHLEYYRVPITAEEAPEPVDFDTLLSIVREGDDGNDEVSSSLGSSESSGSTSLPFPSTHGTVYVFNCQMGLGRSTMGSVIGLEILAMTPLSSLTTTPTEPPKTMVQYKVITNLIRMLKFGNEAKRLTDHFIEQAGSIINLRTNIDDYRKAAHRSTDDRRNCRKLVNKGIHSLKRYALLILFQAYLLECKEQQKDEIFESWLKRHQEFGNLFHELESQELEGLTVLSEKPKTNAPTTEQAVPSHSASAESVGGPHHQHKVQAKVKEIKEVVAGRQGSVLAPLTILKFDHFIGCQKQSLQERIEGAPNFRQVALSNYNNTNDDDDVFVCGLAMPTVDAIERVLKRIKCIPGGPRKCLWISMREEPVIFVNSQPFVLRIVKDPITNLEMTGIISERVELMEERLKAEAEEEARRYGNRLLLHEEEQVPGVVPFKFEIVPEWEDIVLGGDSSGYDGDDNRHDDNYDSNDNNNYNDDNNHYNDSSLSLQSPAQVYQNVIQNKKYPLSYVRVPVTDEQAPIPHVFDELVKLISAQQYTDFIFNCQMGRGRTTTGMIITMIYHQILNNEQDDDTMNYTNDTMNYTNDTMNYSTTHTTTPHTNTANKYLMGEYKMILQLCQLLDQGQKAKRLTDHCIDACSQMQNLREAIYDHKVRLANPSTLTPGQIKETESRGLHYLIRYFYLIVFAEYLLEELKKDQKRTPMVTFLAWLAERREISNLTTNLKPTFE